MSRIASYGTQSKPVATKPEPAPVSVTIQEEGSVSTAKPAQKAKPVQNIWTCVLPSGADGEMVRAAGCAP